MTSNITPLPDHVVYLIAKAPVPGKVKTRLCPPLAMEQAAALQAAFLGDMLEVALTLPATAVKLMAPTRADAAYLEGVLTVGVKTCWQQGEGLGAGLEEGFVQALQLQGFKAAAMLSCDNPDLDPRILSQGFAALDQADVVLGPSMDGGYYFIAARQVYPWLFRDMTWSTARVCDETRRRVKEAGLTCSLLPAWPDIDTIADLSLLEQRLHQANPTVALHTRLALAAIGSHLQGQQQDLP